MNDTTRTLLPIWAARLGYAGLLPFVALAAWALLAGADQRSVPAHALLAYGATITSFLGAIHWGLAMRSPQQGHATTRDYVWGVVPSLVAWCALLSSAAVGLLVLVLSLWACYVVDRNRYPIWGLQHWLPMRRRLTLVASVCCLTGAAALRLA